jgi:hypothetical protein
MTVIGVVAAPAGASAADYVEKCHQNSDTITLPSKTDLIVTPLTCVYKNGTYTYARIKLMWSPDDEYPWGSGHKFDDFEVIVNLERRVNGDDQDRVVIQKTCDFTDEVNATWDSQKFCTTGKTTYDSSYDWSGDGYIRYDKDNDGKGASLWFLTGSPLLK